MEAPGTLTSVLIGYVLLVIVIGTLAARLTKNMAGYFLAERKLGPVVTALSSVASSESGWITLGAVGMGYQMGASAIWFVPGCLLGYVVNWYFLAERLRSVTAKQGALTIPDYLEARFGDKSHLVRGVGALIIFLCMMGYVAAQFTASGKVFHAVFRMDYTYGVLLGAGVTILYTLLGGFRAVSWTDTLQATLMVLGLILMPLVLLLHLGGPTKLFYALSKQPNAQILSITVDKGEVTKNFKLTAKPITVGPDIRFEVPLETKEGRAYRLEQAYDGEMKVFPVDDPGRAVMITETRPGNIDGMQFSVNGKTVLISGEALASPSGKKTGAALFGLIVGLLGIGLGYPGQPHVLTRYMACASRRNIRIARFVAITWGVFAFYGAVGLGLCARVLRPYLEDPEYAFPSIAIDFLPPLLAGLVLASVVAAIMSTADSQLLVAASAVTRDIFNRTFFHGRLQQPTLLAISRITVLVLGVLSVLFALSEVRVVFWFVLVAWAGLGASFGPVILLSLYWKGVTKWGAVAGMITGFTATAIWSSTPVLKDFIYELPPAFALSALAVVVVSLFTKRPELDNNKTVMDETKLSA